MTIDSLWIAFGLTLVLMMLHYFAPHLRRLPGIPEAYTNSFSGGFAVAYVFLHLLPGLVESKETVGAILAKTYHMSPMLDLTVYVIGLGGLLFFFALERITVGDGGGASRKDFYIHVAATALLNGLITYTMPLRVQAGYSFAFLFTVAIGLHFMLIDQSFERKFPRYFNLQGRLILNAALLVGWILAMLTEPENLFVAAMLSAFLGGSVLMNVFKNELPEGKQSSFPWFMVGVAVGTGLLIVLTAVKAE